MAAPRARRSRSRDAAKDADAAKHADDKKQTAVSYWRQRIEWYPNGCFGPYRTTGYSRRELAADMFVHVLGVVAGLVSVGALVTTLMFGAPPAEVVVSVCVYNASLLTMLICSAVFNSCAWSKQHIWALQLADHAGILLLIAGTYSPMMTMACCPRALAFVWSLALISFAAKASHSRLDKEALHVPCFLLMGWTALAVWADMKRGLTPWAVDMCVLGGVLYTVGLVPWACNPLEGHNALWHVFVLAASACFYTVMILEVAQPQHWQGATGGDGTCLLQQLA